MPRAKRPKPVKVKKQFDPQRAQRVRKITMHAVAALVVLGLLSAGVWRLRQYVERDLAFSARPPKVVLVNRPAWMSDFLADQIIAAVRPVGTHSAFDHQLLIDTNAMLRSNPWIKHVKAVRRAYDKKPGDTLEIDCEYRAPIALVHWKDYYWLVDGEAVKLPEQFKAEQLPRIVIGADRKLNIRVIEGVAQPPVESGEKWPGEDLQSGLDLVKLLHGQPFAEEIVKIDVANFGGRISQKEAQLVLSTRHNTEIRWGRPVASRDFFVEVSPHQKLRYLQQVYEQFHRVDGNQPWLDIRFDKITYPSSAGASTARTARLDDAR